MSQESSYLKRQSYNPPNYMNNPYKSKETFRYSTQTYPRTTTSVPTRRYATLEESEEVLPVFTTPTNMYLRQYPQPQQYNMYSNQQNYNYNRNQSSPYTNQSTPSSRNSNRQQQQQQQEQFNSGNTAKDAMVAQLVEMGFDIARARLAIDATGTNNLQDALDLLVSQDNIPPVPEKDAASNGYSTPPQPPPHGRPSPPTKNSPQHEFPTPPMKNAPFPTTPSKSTPKQEYMNTPPKSTPKQEYFTPPSKQEYTTPSPQKNTPQPEYPKNTRSSSQQDYFSSNKRYSTPSFKSTPQQEHAPKNNNRQSYAGTSTPQQEQPPKSTNRQSYAGSATPPQPYSTPPTSFSPKPDPAITYANKERKQGNFSFNRGQFRESEASYTLAINALPTNHGDLPLLLNNRAAALIKQAKYKDCLRDCSLAIDIATRNINLPTTPIMLETSTTMKAQWIKALHRKACALEGLGNYSEAITVYEEYANLDGAHAAQVSQGIARCKQALVNGKTSTKPGWTADKDREEIEKSKAVQEMRDREKKREAEEAEKVLKEDAVNAKIIMWKAGKERNLRALLSTLEVILWSGVQWKGVSMGDLMEPRKCKITYMKAIAKVHPDKLPSNSTVEQRMLASSIFTTLNQAWDVFKTENNL